MKTWIKFIFYLVVGLCSMATIEIGIMLLLAPETILASTFAGVCCLICSISCCMWVMYNGFNLKSW